MLAVAAMVMHLWPQWTGAQPPQSGRPAAPPPGSGPRPPGAPSSPPPSLPAQPPGGAQPEKKITLDDLPPAVRLGIRSAQVRHQVPAIPTVVIVPDVWSYVAAIGRWSTEGRFPVLLDDGSWLGRENIARFVRAYGPKSVVRWSIPETEWPKDQLVQRVVVESVVAVTWGAKDYAAYPDRLRAINLLPPGVVVASMRDPAWTAAAALAAGHGELLLWIDDAPQGGVDSVMDLRTADAFGKSIEAACAASGFRWSELGDDIDAVTLCLQVPAKTKWSWPEGRPAPLARGAIWPQAGEPVATTDLIGRHDRAGTGGGGERMERWAWAGQIFGSSAQAAYRAMSGLFLKPEDGWFFDGYESNPPWSLYDATDAANQLRRYEVNCRVDDEPRQGLKDWRDRAAGEWTRRAEYKDRRGPVGCVQAGVIAVNTSGMSDSFDLRPGKGLAGDIPFLAAPAMVHFVHSWSAQSPTARWTICGRWLERGVYAYLGSVHEPYLQAFQPTPVFIKRMMGPMPFGAAARVDGLPPWRLAVIGDPLLVWPPAFLGAPIEPASQTAPMKDTIDLRAELGELLKADKVAEGFANLLVTGRDADLVRLARAMLEQKPDQVTPEAALLALGAAQRRVELDVLTGLYAKALPLAAKEPAIYDVAWHTLWPSAGLLNDQQADLLAASIRPDSFARDADEASRVIRRLRGDGGRRAFLEGLMAKTTDANRRRDIDALLNPSK